MTTNNISPENIEASNDLRKDKNDIFKYLINYFDLDKNTLDIKIPYKFNDALDYLGNISLGNLSTELKEIIPIEEKESMLDDEQNFSIDNIQILTSKLNDNDKIDYILLNDFKKENYIKIPEYSDEDGDNIDKGINIKIISKEDEKKEINIKVIINYQNFAKNLINNLIKKSKFDKAKDILELSNEYIQEELIGKNLQFEIKIFFNSINKVIYTENGDFLFDLQFPPLFKTNFLINKGKSLNRIKKIMIILIMKIFFSLLEILMMKLLI